MRAIKLVIAALVAAFLLAPTGARAACVVTGEIVRILEYPTYSAIYVRTQPLMGDVFYFTVPQAEFRSSVRAAMAGRIRTYVAGIAGACPAAGAIRNGGQVSGLILNP